MQTEIWDSQRIIERMKQHEKLNIIFHTAYPGAPKPVHLLEQFLRPHRMAYYFFAFVHAGVADHEVDAQRITISEGQVLFVLPRQVHRPPDSICAHVYKLAFDNECLSLLPRTYPFLINPFHRQQVTLDEPARQRIRASLEALQQVLVFDKQDNDMLLILAHLHTFLTELNHAYFKENRQRTSINAMDEQLARYIRFKEIIERDFINHVSIAAIARQLSLSQSNLYAIVKKYAGMSPKQYLARRLVLESQRILSYSDISVKELAFRLGFEDPDYLSRLFKKYAGVTIGTFIKRQQELL